jgi:hypothetical protein
MQIINVNYDIFNVNDQKVHVVQIVKNWEN